MPWFCNLESNFASHPARGAWIEIILGWINITFSMPSHPARGAWIEIYAAARQWAEEHRRTPQGVRGLKYQKIIRQDISRAVAPRKGCVD